MIKVPATPSLVILTNSSRSTWKNCQQKFQYAYEQKLEVKRPKSYLIIGSIVGKAIQWLMVGETLKDTLSEVRSDIREGRKTFIGDPQNLLRFEKDASIVEGMVSGWDMNRGLCNNVEVVTIKGKPCIETPFEVDMGRGVKIKGALDLLVREKKKPDRLWILENKNFSRIDKNLIDKLPLNSQIITYLFAGKHAFPPDIASKIQGVLYNVLGKTWIRQTQKESPDQFQQRVVDEYMSEDPEKRQKYFYQEHYYRSQAQLDRFVREIYATADDIRRARHMGIWQQNESFCTYYSGCEFLPICTKGKRSDVMAKYRVREFLHQEVDEEE